MMTTELIPIRTISRELFLEQFGEQMRNPRFIRALYVKFEDNHWQSEIELKGKINV